MDEHDKPPDEHDKPPPSDAPPSRKGVPQRTYESLIEQRIQQAIGAGKFDNLAGQGQPLPPAEDAQVPEHLRAGFRLLKSNGFAPDWIEARKEIDEQRAKLAGWLAQHQAHWPRTNVQRRATLRAEYQGKLRDLHRTILSYNLRLPPGVPQIENINMGRELARLGEAGEGVSG